MYARNVCFPCQRIDSSKRDDEEEVSHFTNWHRFRAITHDAEYRKESHRNTCLYLRIAHEVDEHEDTESYEDECEEEILAPMDLMQRYQEERASLNAEIDRVLAELSALLGGAVE